MRTLSPMIAVISTILLFMTPNQSPAAAPENSLAQYRWKSRLIILSAPPADAANLVKQRELWHKAQTEAAERDLILIDLTTKPAAERAAIQRQYEIPADRFTVLLIGKDGGAKERAKEPISLQKWFGEIDTMPMRRDEMRAKNSSAHQRQ